jgi:hypothetical protein
MVISTGKTIKLKMKEFNINKESGQIFLGNAQLFPGEGIVQVKQDLLTEGIRFVGKADADASIIVLDDDDPFNIGHLIFTIDLRFNGNGELVGSCLLLINGKSSSDMDYDYNVSLEDKRTVSGILKKKYGMSNIKKRDKAHDIACYDWGTILIVANELSLMCDTIIDYSFVTSTDAKNEI